MYLTGTRPLFKLAGMTNPDSPEVVVVERERGGWLAVSAIGEPLRLAVVGPDESTARHTFKQSVVRWLELCEAARERDNA